MIVNHPPTRLILFFLIFACWIVPVDRLQGAFHLWTISQVYSNDDGSVQFIELFVCCSGENFIDGFDVVTHRDGGQDEQRFTLSEVDGNTEGRHLLLATGPIAGVDQDFTIPANFVPIDFESVGTVDISPWAWAGFPNRVDYDFIPTDGFRSIDGHGDIQDPATVTNYSGDSAVVTPPDPPEPPAVPEIASLSFSGGTFSLSFSTEAGRTYTVEFVNELASEGWAFLDEIEGTGDVETVSDSTATTTRRFYRIVVQ